MAEKSHARLGLFLVISLVVVLGTLLFFAQRGRDRPVMQLVTYADSNVAGLDISSAVRFRGVHIGQVDDLRIDPDGVLVEIDFEVFLDRVERIGSDVETLERGVLLGFPNLRASVVRNFVTGEAYLLLDLPQNPPPPLDLGFEPDRPYVPFLPSTLASMQERLPELITRAEAVLTTVETLVLRFPDSLDRADHFFTNVDAILTDSQLPQLSSDTREFFATAATQIDQITAQIDDLLGARGTLVDFVDEARATMESANLPETAAATRDALDRTTLAADDLRRSLPVMRDALEQLRELARLLDAQPESLVFGSRPPNRESR
ncbi:MAG: MlaD family protein [Acidobacteriota bacterium]|jgi:paraquat-inducible protein B